METIALVMDQPPLKQMDWDIHINNSIQEIHYKPQIAQQDLVLSISLHFPTKKCLTNKVLLYSRVSKQNKSSKNSTT